LQTAFQCTGAVEHDDVDCAEVRDRDDKRADDAHEPHQRRIGPTWEERMRMRERVGGGGGGGKEEYGRQDDVEQRQQEGLPKWKLWKRQ
jgi:hypothetical protein